MNPPVLENIKPDLYDNAPERVAVREAILAKEREMKAEIERGQRQMLEAQLTHFFTPKSETYGCYIYARQMFFPKGSTCIGKIHREKHLNFIMKGTISIGTETGVMQYKAPAIFISEIGVKRVLYADDDTLICTVHLTKHTGEENLDKIEAELIAPTYADLGLISSLTQLKIDDAIERVGAGATR